MTRRIALPGFRMRNGKLEKAASYHKNVSQRIGERKSKKQRVARRQPG
jgi:hypothetical protein